MATKAQHPLSLHSMLPAGMSTDDFYMIAGGLVILVLAAVTVLPMLMKKKNRDAKRLRMLQERRAELRGELTKAKRRKRRPEGSVNLMRRVVQRFQLLKSEGVTQIQNLMVEAGFRSKDALVVYAFFSLASPILFVIIILSFVDSALFQLVSFFALWGFFLIAVADCLFVGFMINRKLRAKFGEDRIQRGNRWYAAMRAMQMRLMRLPKPQVKRGHFPA